MIRYDDIEKEKKIQESVEKKVVETKVLTENEQDTLIETYVKKMSEVVSKDNEPIIKSITNNNLSFNTTEEELSKIIGKPLQTLKQFCFEFYVYKIDEIIKELYGNVIIVNEPLLIMEQQQDSKTVSYEIVR